MDNKTICELFESSVEVSDFKKSFMCAQESLREGLMSSPWPVIVYALSVIFVAFLTFVLNTVPGIIIFLFPLNPIELLGKVKIKAL